MYKIKKNMVTNTREEKNEDNEDEIEREKDRRTGNKSGRKLNKEMMQRTRKIAILIKILGRMQCSICFCFQLGVNLRLYRVELKETWSEYIL